MIAALHRAGVVPVLRIIFLIVCGFFAWRVFDGRWEELGPALKGMSYWVLASLFLTIAGLLVTSHIWTTILASYGASLPWARVSPVFFVGQVGKYVPGSVWSIGAQARMLGGLGASAGIVIGTGLLFLALHVASGLCLGGLALVVWEPSVGYRLIGIGLAVAGASVFHPQVLGLLSRLVTGGRHQTVTSWARSGRYATSMLAVWFAYAAALVVLASDQTWSHSGLMLAAVTLSYAAGVLVVIAPAGLGAREVVFVALTAPVLGLAEATALALVGRLVHTVADFLLAAVGVSWLHRAD